MLKNEFQSMIEQYSNELMNISRQSGGDVPVNAQPIIQEKIPSQEEIPAQEEVPASAAVQSENEVPAAADLISQEDVAANAVPEQQNNEVSVNAEPASQKAVESNADVTPVQNTNVTQPSKTPPMKNTAQPRDIPENNAAANAQRPISNNDYPYTDNSSNMTYEQFLSENPGSGTLKVQVFSGNQSNPIPNAEVTVCKELLDGTKIFFSGLTDISGIVDNIQLPAPARALSETPQPRGDGVELQLPYSQYNVMVKEPRYRPQKYIDVPIFDGIKSIQPVRMTPIQFENNSNSEIIFSELEPKNL